MIHWNRCRDESVRVAGILIVFHQVQARLGVKLDQRRSIRNGDKTPKLGIQREVIQARRRLLLVVHVVTIGDGAGVGDDGFGRRQKADSFRTIGSRRSHRTLFPFQLGNFLLHLRHGLLHLLHGGLELFDF